MCNRSVLYFSAFMLIHSAAIGAQSATLNVLNDAVFAKPYKIQLSFQVTGRYPFTFSIVGGALPSCLRLSPEGILDGIAANTCRGTYAFTVAATDFNGVQTTQSYVLHVTDGKTIVAQPPASQPSAASRIDQPAAAIGKQDQGQSENSSKAGEAMPSTSGLTPVSGRKRANLSSVPPTDSRNQNAGVRGAELQQAAVGAPATITPVLGPASVGGAATPGQAAANPPVLVAVDLEWVDPVTGKQIGKSKTLGECVGLTLLVTASTVGQTPKPVASGTVFLTDDKIPGTTLKVAIDKGIGRTPLPALGPETYVFTPTFEGTDKYSYYQDPAKPSSIEVTVTKALQPSTTCPYRMPPLLSTVVGLDVEGASSTSPAARFLGNVTGDIPIYPALTGSDRMTNIAQARWFVGGALRIAAMAQPGQLSGSAFTAGYLATAVNSTPDKIVQSWEGTGSISVRLWKLGSTNLGMGTFDNGKPTSSTFPRNTLVTTSLLLSGGFISPLSAAQANPAVFYATQQIQKAYPGVNWPSSCLAYLSQSPVGTPSCYAAFIPEDRLRFYRHYEAGLRFRFYGEDFDHNTLRFPGIIDLAVGQNEYVTAGNFNGVVIHFGGMIPIPVPKVDGLYAFGVMDSAVNGPIGGGAQLLLEPVPSTANVNYLSNSVYDISVAQPNRDRYRFGFGIDLYHLLAAKSQKQGASSQSSGDAQQ